MARPRSHFVTAKVWKCWNTKFAGKPAFITIDKDGYRTGKIDYIVYKAGRIIWKLVTGKEPLAEVEHRNRKRADNTWINLRLAAHMDNGANRNLPANNKSGHVGVHFSKTEKKWKAYARRDGVRHSFGTHAKKRDAIIARQAGAKNLFGEFAP